MHSWYAAATSSVPCSQYISEIYCSQKPHSDLVPKHSLSPRPATQPVQSELSAQFTPGCQITLAALLSPTGTVCPGPLFFSTLLHWRLSVFLADGDLKEEALSPSSSKHRDAGQVIGTQAVAVCLWHPCQAQDISNSQRLY